MTPAAPARRSVHGTTAAEGPRNSDRAGITGIEHHDMIRISVNDGEPASQHQRLNLLSHEPNEIQRFLVGKWLQHH